MRMWRGEGRIIVRGEVGGRNVVDALFHVLEANVIHGS